MSGLLWLVVPSMIKAVWLGLVFCKASFAAGVVVPRPISPGEIILSPTLSKPPEVIYVLPLTVREPFTVVVARVVDEAIKVPRVVVPLTPKFPPIVWPPETSEPTVRVPAIFAFPPTAALPETFKLDNVVEPAASDPPIVVSPPIAVLLETVKEFPLKLDEPPVMAEPIAELKTAVKSVEADETALPIDVPIELA